VLSSCSVPIIIKKENDSYKFVGDSYVQGIMDGEATTMAAEGKLEETEFILR
jgi:hypothetical protein